MNMKKIIAMILVLSMALSLAACGGSDKPYTSGLTLGSVYNHSYFGFKCVLPEGWSFYTDEQIAQLQGNAQDIEKSGSAMEMYASEDSTGGLYTLNVVVEKLPSAALSEEKYVESCLDKTKAALESAGFQIDVCKAATVQFAGKTHAAIEIQGTYMGLDLYETLVVVKEGKYLACVTACSFMENYTSDILGFCVAA
jgi:hypothetical protein